MLSRARWWLFTVVLNRLIYENYLTSQEMETMSLLEA